MKPTLSITSRQLMLRELHDYLMIALGMLFYAIGWTVFLLPNDITTGGVPGIASIVYWATGLNVQYTYFAINGGLLIASLIVLGWRFSVKTIFAVLVMTFILPIIQGATAGLHLLGDQPFMACVIGASFCGSGIGIAFSANGRTRSEDDVRAGKKAGVDYNFPFDQRYRSGGICFTECCYRCVRGRFRPYQSKINNSLYSLSFRHGIYIFRA